jgi:hypothetical protein
MTVPLGGRFAGYLVRRRSPGTTCEWSQTEAVGGWWVGLGQRPSPIRGCRRLLGSPKVPRDHLRVVSDRGGGRMVGGAQSETFAHQGGSPVTWFAEGPQGPPASGLRPRRWADGGWGSVRDLRPSGSETFAHQGQRPSPILRVELFTVGRGLHPIPIGPSPSPRRSRPAARRQRSWRLQPDPGLSRCF